MAKVILLSNRKNLVNGVRQALNELKFAGEKEFAETVDALFGILDGTEQAVVIIDWDLGAPVINDFFNNLKTRTNKEFWPLFLISSDQSEKIIAAAAEWGVAKIHTGSLTPIKIKLAIDELLSHLTEDLTLKSVMTRIHEARQLENWAEVTKILEDIYKAEPMNRRVAYELAETYLQTQDYQKCLDFLKPWTEMDPADTRLMHVAGKIMVKMGRYEEAAEVMSKADIINPFNCDRLIELGNAFLNLDKVAEAEDAFNRAQVLEPENFEATKGVGTVKLMEGDVNEALKILKDKISGRELASVFNTAAVISMRQERFEKGMSLYDAAAKALSVDTSLVAKIYYNKGIGFFRWQKPEEAKSCFQEALRLDPSYKNAKQNISAIESGKAAQAKAENASAAKTSSQPDSKSTEPNLIPLDPAPNTAAAPDPEDISFDDGMSDVFEGDVAEEDERI